MEELAISEAARRYGIAERSIRKWIEQEKLAARKTTLNGRVFRLVRTDELELLIAEKNMQTEHADTSYQQQIDELKQEMCELNERMTELESKIAQISTAKIATAPISSSTETPTKSAGPESQINRHSEQSPQNSDLPEGCILLKIFAIRHGVPANTAKRHHLVGFKCDDGTFDRLEASSKPKPSRPGETTYFLTSEQQERALAFWTRNGVKISK